MDFYEDIHPLDLFSDLEERKRFNLSYWINPDRSELFFAKKIILLEGQTDKSVLPMLAKQLEVYRYDFTLIDCGSKDTIPQYINLLNKFRLKYVVVYDKDHQEWKNHDAINSADSSSRLIEDIIDSNFGESIIFINDIEEEIGIIERNKRNKPYLAIKHVDDDFFQISEALKTKVEKIFE